MKTLVLGLGNPILSDDGVGLRIIRELKKKLCLPGITIAETYLGGINLLEELTGYQKVIIIDAIQTKDGSPGQVYRLGPEDLDTTNHIASSHEAGFAAILELGRQSGLSLPDDICIYAVEVEDTATFSETCTPKVKEAIPLVVEQVLQECGHGKN